MASLTEELKTEVVCRLARFDSPSEVVAWLKATHDVETTIRQIMGYDLGGEHSMAGEKWRPIFDAARKGYLENVEAVPIGSQAFRLNELDRLYQDARRRKNSVLAASLLEQAAKEVGGIYTNIRNLNVPPGAGDALPAVERRAALAKLVDQSFGRGPGQPVIVDGTATRAP